MKLFNWLCPICGKRGAVRKQRWKVRSHGIQHIKNNHSRDKSNLIEIEEIN